MWSSTRPVHLFDFVIIGGGFAAWTCAVTLRMSGYSVAIMSRDERNLAIGEYLPSEGVFALKRLGIGSLLNHPAHRPSPGVISLWNGPSPTVKPVLSMPGGRAFNLDRRVFSQELKERAAELGVTHFKLIGPPNLMWRANHWHINQGVSKTPLFAKHLVDATGRSAILARKSAIPIIRHDNLVGLAAMFENITVEDAFLRVEALSNGWAYAAPLSEDRLVFVFLTDAKTLPPAIGQQRKQLIIDELSESKLIAPILGKGDIQGIKFQPLPAWSQLTKLNTETNWTAIGDAAMSFDPLASAGMTKALLDIGDLRNISDKKITPEQLQKKRAQRYETYRTNLTKNYQAADRQNSAFWRHRSVSHLEHFNLI